MHRSHPMVYLVAASLLSLFFLGLLGTARAQPQGSIEQAAAPATPASNAQPQANQPDLNSFPACVPSAPDGYPKNTCVATVDRDNPASPPTLIVRGKTTVIIRVKNARWNESVGFTTTTSQVTDVDIAGTFLKNAASPLQQLIFAQTAHSGRFIEVKDALGDEQKLVKTKLEAVLLQLANTTTGLTCLETYKALTTDDKYSCNPNQNLDAKSFDAAKAVAIDYMLTAATAALPVAEYQDVDAQVKNDITKNIALPASAQKAAALAKDDNYSTNQTLLNSVIADAQTTQKTLMETAQQLRNLPGSPREAIYTIKQNRNYNSTVTVAAQEVISKTSTALATVTINWQSNPWEISTGILFSTLVGRSYINAPIIQNGQPALDSSGKNETIVTENDTRPTIDFPVVMGNFRVRALSNANWENKCPNHCSVLLSGGIGLNLTSTKSAEFVAGPSFQIGEFMLTPAAHFGRETVLTNGVSVGAELGSSPPSTLPTTNKWRTGFALVVSYVLPFQ